ISRGDPDIIRQLFRRSESEPEDLPECKKCPPGLFASKPCFHGTDTVCTACEDGTFTDKDNVDTECQPCSQCGVGLFQAQACTRTSDTVCDSCASTTATDLEDYRKACLGEEEKEEEQEDSDVQLGSDVIVDPDVKDMHEMMLGDDASTVPDDVVPTDSSHTDGKKTSDDPKPETSPVVVPAPVEGGETTGEATGEANEDKGDDSAVPEQETEASSDQKEDDKPTEPAEVTEEQPLETEDENLVDEPSAAPETTKATADTDMHGPNLNLLTKLLLKSILLKSILLKSILLKSIILKKNLVDHGHEDSDAEKTSPAAVASVSPTTAAPDAADELGVAETGDSRSEEATDESEAEPTPLTTTARSQTEDKTHEEEEKEENVVNEDVSVADGKDDAETETGEAGGVTTTTKQPTPETEAEEKDEEPTSPAALTATPSPEAAQLAQAENVTDDKTVDVEETKEETEDVKTSLAPPQPPTDSQPDDVGGDADDVDEDDDDEESTTSAVTVTTPLPTAVESGEAVNITDTEDVGEEEKEDTADTDDDLQPALPALGAEDIMGSESNDTDDVASAETSDVPDKDAKQDGGNATQDDVDQTTHVSAAAAIPGGDTLTVEEDGSGEHGSANDTEETEDVVQPNVTQDVENKTESSVVLPAVDGGEDSDKEEDSKTSTQAPVVTDVDVHIEVGDDTKTTTTHTPTVSPTPAPVLTTTTVKSKEDDEGVDIVLPVEQPISKVVTTTVQPVREAVTTTKRIPTLEEVESSQSPGEGQEGEVVDLGSGEVPGIVIDVGKEEESKEKTTTPGVDVNVGVERTKPPGGPSSGTRRGHTHIEPHGKQEEEEHTEHTVEPEEAEKELEEAEADGEASEIEVEESIGDSEEDTESKKRTAIIVGVAIGGVALFAILFLLSRVCRKRGSFKVMKKVPSENEAMGNGNAESIEFRPLSDGTGIYDEVDETGHVGSKGGYRKINADNNYTPLASAPAPNEDPVYAVVNKKRQPPKEEIIHDSHVNGIDKIRYIDETTDDEGGEPTARDRLLPPKQREATVPEVDDEERPEPESKQSAASTSGESQTSLSTDVLNNLEKKMGEGTAGATANGPADVANEVVASS
ncbi:hypothetical protein BaRGS_00008326, partial [Batillaria attramentaria]